MNIEKAILRSKTLYSMQIFDTILNRPNIASRSNHLPVENAEEEIGELHTVASYGGFCEQRTSSCPLGQILLLIRSLQNNVRRKTKNE
jgi:hypothetical protein